MVFVIMLSFVFCCFFDETCSRGCRGLTALLRVYGCFSTVVDEYVFSLSFWLQHLFILSIEFFDIIPMSYFGFCFGSNFEEVDSGSRIVGDEFLYCLCLLKQMERRVFYLQTIPTWFVKNKKIDKKNDWKINTSKEFDESIHS